MSARNFSHCDFFHCGSAQRRRFFAALSCVGFLAAGFPSAEAQTARNMRPMKEELRVHGVNVGFAVHKMKAQQKVNFYYKKGTRSLEYMCQNKPNSFVLDMSKQQGKRVIRRADINRRDTDPFENNKAYTVMADLNTDGNCIYSMVYLNLGPQGDIAFNPLKSPRKLRKMESLFFLYQHHSNFIVRNNDDMRHHLVHFYYKEGHHSAKTMCRDKPNQVSVRMDQNTDEKTIESDLEYPKHYTIMADLDEGGDCVYAMVHFIPWPYDGVTARRQAYYAQTNVEMLNAPNDPRVSAHANEEEAILLWPKPEGDLRWYRLFVAQGNKKHNTIERMCRPGMPHLQPGTFFRNTRIAPDAREHRVGRLYKGNTYTFLLVARFRDRPDLNCSVVQHVTKSPNKVEVSAIAHASANTDDLPAGQVRLKWRKQPNVRAWHIYRTGGEVGACKLGATRPSSRIVNDGNQDEYIYDRLASGKTYTFLVVPWFQGDPPPNFNTRCKYALHAVATAS
ncbi:MAG: hypothetical protein ACR2P7_01790 [bacterium]